MLFLIIWCLDDATLSWCYSPIGSSLGTTNSCNVSPSEGYKLVDCPSTVDSSSIGILWIMSPLNSGSL